MRMRMRPAVRSPQKPSQPTHVVKTRYSSRFSHKPPGPAAARRHRQPALLGDRGCAPRAFVVPELATELRSLDDWHDPHNQRLAHARARLTSMDLPTGRPLEIRWDLRGGGGEVNRARVCVGSASGPAAPQGSIKAQDLLAGFLKRGEEEETRDLLS